MSGHDVSKIQTLPELAPGRWVLCSGDFDLLLPETIRMLAEARNHGDRLAVLVTPDKARPRISARPPVPERERGEALAALTCVDAVIIGRGASAEAALRTLHPVAFLPCRGKRGGLSRGTGLINGEERAVKELGVAVLEPPTMGFAPHHHQNPLWSFPAEVDQYLDGLAAAYDPEAVLERLESVRDLKVLVVGETIIDEYHYCETLGKSGKEPILVTKFVQAETFAGGVLAIANNLAAFCDHVDVLTVLGRQDGRPDPTEPFIREHLDPRIGTHIVYQDEAPTIVKRRFVEQYPLQKLFEVYVIKHLEANSPVAAELCQRLEGMLPDYDLVIVADYGHGMITPEAVRILCERARRLAVNTQTNADNQGFNTICKYPRADFVSISEKELRLEVRSRQRATREIMEEVGRKLNCRGLLVTQGNKGNLLYSPAKGFFSAPSLTLRIVDRVGAGDAVFAVTSLLMAKEAPLDLVAFVGNVVGAHAVGTVGHRTSLEPAAVAEHISILLE